MPSQSGHAPYGALEGEGTRFNFFECKRMVVRAGAFLRVSPLPPRIILIHVDQFDDDDAIGQPQRGFDGVRQSGSHPLAGHQAIDDDVDIVPQFLLQLGRIVKVRTVSPSTRARV